MGKKTATLLKIKQASRRLKRLACRMTMLTVMTMFLIYPFTLSHEHRHHRHLRHYRHTRAARGSGEHPRNAFVDIQTLCLRKSWSAPAYTARAAAAICCRPPNTRLRHAGGAGEAYPYEPVPLQQLFQEAGRAKLQGLPEPRADGRRAGAAVKQR